MKIPMLIISFIMISALFIISNDNLHMQNASDRAIFGNSYYLWLGSLFDNMKAVTGYVVHANWLPVTNKTILNKTE
jgi:hypothetical protein